jgi:hypothetical protein
MSAGLPLSNLQVELLKLYQGGVSEEDLIAINTLIVSYFAEKTKKAADKIWLEKGYSDVLMDEWLGKDLRK